MKGISRTQISFGKFFSPVSCASVGTIGPLLMTAVRLAKQTLDKGSDFLDRMTGRVRSPGYLRGLLRMRSLSTTSIPASACAQLWQIRQGLRLL